MIVDPSLVWCGSPKIVEAPDSPRNRSTASRISMISIVASKPQHCASIDRWPSGGIRAGASSDGGRRSCWPGFSFSSAQAQSTRPSQNPQPGIGHFSQSGFSRRSGLLTTQSKPGETGTNLSQCGGRDNCPHRSTRRRRPVAALASTDDRIPAIKALRELHPGLGLKDAMDLIDAPADANRARNTDSCDHHNHS